MAGFSNRDPVAVVGAGTMGTGIAQVAATHGHPVFIYDQTPGLAEQACRDISDALDRRIQRGRINEADKTRVVERLNPVASIEGLASAALVIEAVIEELDQKWLVFRELERVCNDDALLATNTSSLSVTEIASVLSDPGRLIGLHFFNPPPAMKLVEVVRGEQSHDIALETAFDTVTAWGKLPVLVKSSPGFIVNRVARPFYGEALRLLEEGCAGVATIDAILRDCGGFRMGPFELMDLIGNDVNFTVTRTIFDAFFGDDRFKPSHRQLELVRSGHLGRKTGRGFYDYAAENLTPSASNEETLPAPVTVAFDPTAWPFREFERPRSVGSPASDREADLYLRADQAFIALTDGRTATRRSFEEGIENLVLFDLCFDFGTTPRVALAVADQASPDALRSAIGFFQSLDKAVSIVDDTAGLIVMRTVCLLINEAAETVYQGVATAEDLDKAMTHGVNYPLGPLAWADRLGAARVTECLHHLKETYGENRYRASALLQRLNFSAAGFHNPNAGNIDQFPNDVRTRSARHQLPHGRG